MTELGKILRKAMTNPKALGEAIAKPTKIISLLPRVLKRDIIRFQSLYQRKLRSRSGINVMEQDWDNLLILDACRFDLFEQLHDFEGRLDSVISPGSSTYEFLHNTFEGQRHPDTVYVTANPRLHKIDCEFHHVEPLWQTDWDEQAGVVRPETVVERALEIDEEYPNKRLIVHFMQPHEPFLGDLANQLPAYGPDSEDISIWGLLDRGKTNPSDVWDAYRENLELTLPHVERLTDGLAGKSVITADHGNAFGEWSLYGHPAGYFVESLVKVPWLIIEDTPRKEITTGARTERADLATGNVKDRLTALGYRS
jgi:hypothetical protein